MFLSKSKIQSQEDLVENASCNSCRTFSALFLIGVSSFEARPGATFSKPRGERLELIKIGF